MSEASDPSDEQRLRTELSALDAEIGSIPSDQFAERAPLLRRRDEVTAELRSLVGTDPDTLAAWNERAAGKPDDSAEPYIPSVTEPGGTA